MHLLHLSYYYSALLGNIRRMGRVPTSGCCGLRQCRLPTWPMHTVSTRLMRGSPSGISVAGPRKDSMRPSSSRWYCHTVAPSGAAGGNVGCGARGIASWPPLSAGSGAPLLSNGRADCAPGAACEARMEFWVPGACGLVPFPVGEPSGPARVTGVVSPKSSVTGCGRPSAWAFCTWRWLR